MQNEVPMVLRSLIGDLIRNLPQPAAAEHTSVEISGPIRPVSGQKHGSNDRFGDLQACFTQPLGTG